MCRHSCMATLFASLLLAACGSPRPRERTPSGAPSPGVADNRGETVGSQEEVDTTSPADVSHGEAVIGGPSEADSAPRPAGLAPAEHSRLRRIRLEIKHATITIAPEVRYAAWTFGGSVPGPALHVRQGDTVDFTLLNHGNIPHSMDFHAAEIAPSKYYRNLMPGDSLHYRFVARVPGAFMYHCGTAPVALHIANGMYGALVVDPAKPLPPAREFFFVQSEFYLNPKPSADGTRSLDWEKLLSLAPDHVVFNGRADQYASHPIDVKPNELLRLYVVNAGPNRISSFHVVGGIFERVYGGGPDAGVGVGVQTVNIPVGGGSVFQLRLREPGDYPFVTHAFADATKGAVGVFRATAPGEKPAALSPPMAH